MFNWLKNKLGIGRHGLTGAEYVASLEEAYARTTIGRLDRIEKSLANVRGALNRIEKKIRIGRKPQRYDQIERARSRQHKVR